MQKSTEVHLEASNEGIFRITLNRPQRLNALGIGVVAALRQAIAGAVSQRARVLIVRGAGRAFCAGADLKERRSMPESARYEHNRAINAAVQELAEVPMPSIAMINGHAMGGGCEIALACDLRYAAVDAQIGLTEARIGAMPGAGGTQRLPRLIGPARALELMLTGEPINGERAEQIGLVQAATQSDQLEEHVNRIADLLVSRSPSGAVTMKRLVYAGLGMSLAEGIAQEGLALRELLQSDDYREGLSAFHEKRKPRFAAEGW